MVCHLGGLSHPPGYPLYTLLCQNFVKLPLFEPGVVAGNLLSGVFAALAVSLFHHLCYLKRGRLFAWVASLSFAFSATFWSQAIIIEVYTLAVLMFVICWWCTETFVRTGSLRFFYLLGFLYGLALCNHWPLMLLSTPPLLILLWGRRDLLLASFVRPQFWVISILSLLAGLLPYLSLLDPDPEIAVYGGIDSVADFVRYVTRAMYHDGHGVAGLSDRIAYAIWLVKESVVQPGLWAAPVVLFGIWLGLRNLTKNYVLFLLATYLGSTFILLSMISFDYEYFYRAIFKPYPVIAYLAVAFWFALGVEGAGGWLTRNTGRRFAPQLVSALAVSLVFVGNLSANNRRDDSMAAHYAAAVLEALDDDSTLFVYGDFETALFGYLVLVEGVQTDVELREWESLVFSNRLTSAFASDERKMDAASQYIDTSANTVYSIDKRLAPFTDLGLVYRFNRGGEPATRVLPELDEFVAYLLDLSSQGLITDPHERYHAFHLLIRFSRLYFAYALESGLHQTEVGNRIGQLQATFPGKLVTLEVMLLRKLVSPQNRGALLALAAQAELEIPEVVSNKSLAVFYEYYGRILKFEPEDAAIAMTYFEKSIDVYPSTQNTSICPLRSLAQQHGFKSDNVLNFGDVACP